MSAPDTFERVKRAVADQLLVDPAKIVPSATFIDW